MSAGSIPRERIGAIVERVLPEYGGECDAEAFGWTSCPHDQAGRLDSMASAICDATGGSKDAMLRKLWVVRNDKPPMYRGKPTPGNITFKTADAILSGLGLTHLWHTELADLYEAA